ELWKELELRSHTKLLHETGLVIFGDKKNSEVLRGVRDSSQRYGIAIEEWDPKRIANQFPQAQLPANCVGLFEKTGGYLEVENCVRVSCEQASQLGAELHFQEPVVSWQKNRHGFEVVTSKGRYQSERLVVTAGAWNSRLIQETKPFLRVHRVPLFWFDSKGLFKKEKGVPCFAFDLPEGFFYGFTESGGEVKVTIHRPLGVVENPSEENREVKKEEAPKQLPFFPK
ncbi:FAD-dependent oxidoreductase, partial [bacterium]|nr:FAD-dependent oxidoreductase [bacterium]